MSDSLSELLLLYAQQFEDQHAPQNITIALREAAKELDRLRERLEIDPAHPYDGIYCRDETIRLQDAEIERLKASERSAWNAATDRDEQIDRLKEEVERKDAALEAVRFNLLQAGYKPDSIMIEGIDAALTSQEQPK
jgi:hypothetical protein